MYCCTFIYLRDKIAMLQTETRLLIQFTVLYFYDCN
jgi:hypothetical protein